MDGRGLDPRRISGWRSFVLATRLRTNTFSLTRGLATSYRRPSEWLQELGTTAGAAVQYVLNSLSAPPPSQTNDGVASYIDAVAR